MSKDQNKEQTPDKAVVPANNTPAPLFDVPQGYTGLEDLESSDFKKPLIYITEPLSKVCQEGTVPPGRLLLPTGEHVESIDGVFLAVKKTISLFSFASPTDTLGTFISSHAYSEKAALTASTDPKNSLICYTAEGYEIRTIYNFFIFDMTRKQLFILPLQKARCKQASAINSILVANQPIYSNLYRMKIIKVQHPKIASKVHFSVEIKKIEQLDKEKHAVTIPEIETALSIAVGFNIASVAAAAEYNQAPVDGEETKY